MADLLLAIVFGQMRQSLQGRRSVRTLLHLVSSRIAKLNIVWNL